MFARTNDNLPEEPDFPKNLAELGYKINEKGQFVNVKDGKFFDFFNTDNDRANVIRKEAMHFCARDAVKQAAAGHGIQEIYVTGANGTNIKTTKPVAQHLRILTTKPIVLKAKKDVVIIIGEHTQDPGIWAYRHLMKEGGIDGGSLVGLMKKLSDLGLDATLPETGAGDEDSPVLPETAGAAGAETSTLRKAAVVSGAEDPLALPTSPVASGAEDPLAYPKSSASVEETELGGTNRSDSMVAGVTLPRVPGVIILNPGQLLYSPKLNECMTQATWMARPKFSGIGSNYKVVEEHNRIPGHTTPYEHVDTMFEHVIPQLVGNAKRFWIIGIADGAEHFINYMDSKLAEDHTAKIGGLVTAMVFMEPTHQPNKLQSPGFKTFLHSYGKCWIKSSKPKGTWINVPGGMNPIMSPSQLSLPEKKPGKKPKQDEENKDPGQGVDTDKPIAGSQPIPVSKSGEGTHATEKLVEDPLALPDELKESDEPTTGLVAPVDIPKYRHPVTGEPTYLPPEAYTYCQPTVTYIADPIVVPKSGNQAAGEEEKKVSRKSSTDSDSPPESLMISRMSSGSDVSHPQGGGGSPPLPKSVLSLKSGSSDTNGNTSPTMNSPATLSPVAEESDDDDPMAGSYDYYSNTVSCHTYSAGVDIDEMIWPEVMDLALDFFTDKFEKEMEMEKRFRKQE